MLSFLLKQIWIGIDDVLLCFFATFGSVLGLQVTKGVRKGGLGLAPPLGLVFYKNVLPAQRRLFVFAYILLVNLST